MTLSEIRKMPVIIGNTHESVLRSYHVVKKVEEMLIRKDSHETILEFIDNCFTYDEMLQSKLGINYDKDH